MKLLKSRCQALPRSVILVHERLKNTQNLKSPTTNTIHVFQFKLTILRITQPYCFKSWGTCFISRYCTAKGFVPPPLQVLTTESRLHHRSLTMRHPHSSRLYQLLQTPCTCFAIVPVNADCLIVIHIRAVGKSLISICHYMIL